MCCHGNLLRALHGDLILICGVLSIANVGTRLLANHSSTHTVLAFLFLVGVVSSSLYALLVALVALFPAPQDVIIPQQSDTDTFSVLHSSNSVSGRPIQHVESPATR